jgi:hypothetical protein
MARRALQKHGGRKLKALRAAVKAAGFIDAWTDYPVFSLGDTDGPSSPLRRIKVIAYDGDKYARVQVEGLDHPIVIKRGYCYTKPERLTMGPPILAALLGLKVPPCVPHALAEMLPEDIYALPYEADGRISYPDGREVVIPRGPDVP